MSTYNVLTHGAVGDSQTNDAPAIQAAIDACHAAGGGTVLLSAGRTYLSGSLQLRGQTEFRVERGATLLASPDYADYRPEHFSDAISGGLVDTDSELSRRAWLTAFEAHNLSITGGGVIDGHGRAFIESDLGGICEMRGTEGEEQYQARPYALNLIGCQRQDVGGLTIRDGPDWTLRLTGCDDVNISRLRLHNDIRIPNSDGIDLDRCKRVRISDCDVIAGDDAICLKACRSTAAYGACEDIVVTNCTLRSICCAFKIGSECWSPVRNVTLSNSVIHDSHRGLGMQCVDPGGVENVLFSNLTIQTRMYDERWWGSGRWAWGQFATCASVTSWPTARTASSSTPRTRAKCKAYGVSDNPFGPFQPRGVVLSSQPPLAEGPGHHGYLYLPETDEWLIVYHRRVIGNSDPGARMLCIDRLKFEGDAIKPVVMT